MFPQNRTGTLVALRGALPTASGLADRRRGACGSLRAPTALRPHRIQADPLAAIVLVPDWLLKYKDVLVFWTSALAVGALFDTVLVRNILARVLRVAADSLAPQSHRERRDDKGHEKEKGHEEQEEEEEKAEDTQAAMRHPAPVAETPESARRLMVASSALTALAATVSVRRAGRRAALRPERPAKAASDERSSSRKSTPQFSSAGSRRQSRQLSSQAMQKITSISRQVSNAPRGQPRPQVGPGGASSSSVGKRSPRDTPPRTPPSDTRSTLRSTPRDGDSASTPDLDQASHAVSVDPSLQSHSAPDSADEELEVFKHISSVHWAAGVESPQRKPVTDRHKRFKDTLATRRKSAAGLLLGNDAENDRASNVSSSVRRTSSMPLSWDSLSTGEFKRQQTLDSADTLDMERGGGSHYGSFSSADYGDDGSEDDDDEDEEEEEEDEDDEEYDEEYDEEDYVEEEEEEEDVSRVVEEEGGEDEDESEDDGVREEWWRSEGEDEEGASENPSR